MRSLTRAKFILSFFFCLRALAGDSVNNGAGLAEQNFWLAYSQLPDVYQSCLQSKDCKLTSSEKNLIKKVFESLPQEYQTSNQILFLENQSQSFFLQNGRVFIALTEPEIGSYVWINRDLIYKKQTDDSVHIFSLGQAMAVLTDQLLVHQKVDNPSLRAYISQTIRNFYEKNF